MITKMLCSIRYVSPFKVQTFLDTGGSLCPFIVNATRNSGSSPTSPMDLKGNNAPSLWQSPVSRFLTVIGILSCLALW